MTSLFDLCDSCYNKAWDNAEQVRCQEKDGLIKKGNDYEKHGPLHIRGDGSIGREWRLK